MDETTAATRQQAAEPPFQHEPRKLYRRPDGKMLAGVCSGLAAYTGLDVVIFRIGFVVLTLVSGVGLLAYVGAWLVIPEAGRQESQLQAMAGDRSKQVVLAVLGIIALVIVADEVGPMWHGGGGAVWALLLMAGAAVLWFSRSDGDRPPGPQQPAAAPGSASSVVDRTTVVAPLPAVARPEAPPRPRERSVLSRITVGLLVLMLGLGLLLDSMGLLDLKPREMLAAMLLVVGTALVAGSFWGRGRPLIPLGILLAAALFLASAAQGVPLRGGAGERLIRPLAMSELRRQYQLGAGELTLDLSSLHVPPGTTRVNASVGMGELTVIAPATSGLMVRAQSGAGRVLVLGHESEGLDSRLDRQEPGSELSGTLDLRLKAGMGEVTVTRQGEPALRPGLPGPVPGFGPPFGAVEEVAP